MKNCFVGSLVTVLVLGSSVGCQDEAAERAAKSEGVTGTISVPLVTTGESGATYRLREGFFEIYNYMTGDYQEVYSEDYLEDETIDIVVEQGDYEIYLYPDYWLDMKAPEDEDEEYTPVDATLVSENPAWVFVSPDAVSAVNFVFRLGDGPQGLLTIGIVVQEEGACEDDYEPNDNLWSPTEVSLETPIEATTCAYDNDYYVFESPVPAGELFGIEVKFSNEISDIDAKLYDSSYNLVSEGYSDSDNEILGTVSDGGSYILKVYPFDQTENRYSVGLTSFEQSNCCNTSPLPGCSDGEIEACVCDSDSWCCEVDFDDLCVEIAVWECGLECSLTADNEQVAL